MTLRPENLPHDPADDNLRALCQRCHNQLDVMADAADDDKGGDDADQG